MVAPTSYPLGVLPDLQRVRLPWFASSIDVECSPAVPKCGSSETANEELGGGQGRLALL